MLVLEGGRKLDGTDGDAGKAHPVYHPRDRIDYCRSRRNPRRWWMMTRTCARSFISNRWGLYSFLYPANRTPIRPGLWASISHLFSWVATMALRATGAVRPSGLGRGIVRRMYAVRHVKAKNSSQWRQGGPSTQVA